jgi:hypothetical protein
MIIETKAPDLPLHVVLEHEEIRLGVGKPSGDGLRFTALSVSQAETLLHELERAHD